MADGKARNWDARLIIGESRSPPMGPALTVRKRARLRFRSFSRAKANYIGNLRHSRRLVGEH